MATREPQTEERSGTGPLRFAIRAAIFAAPLVAVVILFEWVLWRSGDTWPVSRVHAVQVEHRNAVFMRGYFDQSFHSYKLWPLEHRKPRILALGSSRVMRFRSEMFGDELADFYNAGGLLQNVDDLHQVAKFLATGSPPKVVILGTDLWWFNAEVPSIDRVGPALDAGWAGWQTHLAAMRALFKSPRVVFDDLGRAPVSRDPKAIGLHARETGRGFRWDGSITIGHPIPATAEGWTFVDRETPPILRRIERGSHQFRRTNGASPERLARFDEALGILKEAGVLVVGYAPPLSAPVAERLEHDAGSATLWSEFHEKVPKLFESRGFPFFDISTTSTLGLDDRYLIDALHAGETFQLHVLSRMLRDERVQTRLPSAAPRISKAAKAPGTNYWQADLESR